MLANGSGLRPRADELQWVLAPRACAAHFCRGVIRGVALRGTDDDEVERDAYYLDLLALRSEIVCWVVRGRTMSVVT